MNDREKLNNLKVLLDTLIDTCKSEVSITNKFLEKTTNNKEKIKLQNELAFWQGKLEVAEYIKYFIN